MALNKTTLFFPLLLLVSLAGSLAFAKNTIKTNAPWDADYFPNTILTDQNGKKFRFFDDLIKGKIVAINFMFTSCSDSCPLETASLVRVQKILGDRVGKEVFFYSITIDPKTDTPKVLKGYKGRFKANWSFFTGNKEEIIELRKKLGLYIDRDDKESNNHNVSLIIGNQKTGRWMKKSPFENAHVLADQLSNWLSEWKGHKPKKNYSKAPSIRQLSAGEQMFRTRCVSCHTIDGSGGSSLGPDLIGVTQRRSATWLIRWLRNPTRMLEEKDPIAMAMFNKYQIAMGDMRLNPRDIFELIKYFNEETSALASKKGSTHEVDFKKVSKKQRAGLEIIRPWIRAAIPGASARAGYLTFANTSSEDITIVSLEGEDFGMVEMHHTVNVDGFMEMEKLDYVTVPANGIVEFKAMGKHLMMMMPTRELKLGDSSTIKVKTKNGEVFSTQLVVTESPERKGE